MIVLGSISHLCYHHDYLVQALHAEVEFKEVVPSLGDQIKAGIKLRLGVQLSAELS